MHTLTSYLKECISPRSKEEYIETPEFDSGCFDRLNQDGFYITSSIPNDVPENCEFITIGDKVIIKKVYRSLEWLDEKTNKIKFDESRNPIYRRIIPPPCETVDHVLIIKSFLSELLSKGEYIDYIEYGVRDGHSLSQISELCDRCYAVDIEQHPKLIVPSNCKFFKMYTTEFSKKHLKDITFNVAFIDADHSSKSAFEDFEHIFSCISKGGYIFLHDTYPCNSMLLKKEFCNDCYKTPFKIKEKYDNDKIELLTFPLNPGVTVIRKISE